MKRIASLIIIMFISFISLTLTANAIDFSGKNSITVDLDELKGTYETKTLYFDEEDRSYGYEAFKQWLTFSKSILVNGFIVEYTGSISGYPEYLDSIGNKTNPKVTSFFGVNFNSAPESWDGTWRLRNWYVGTYDNA